MRNGVLASLLLVGACGGAQVAVNGDGDFAEMGDAFSGSSYAYWRTATYLAETGQLEAHQPSLLELRFVGANLEPGSDYRYEDHETRAEAAGAWARDARLEMTLRSFSDLDNDGQLDELATGTKYTNRDLEAELKLYIARDAIDSSAEVPGAAGQAGTKLTFELEFSGLGREHGATVAGTLNVNIERDVARDPDGVRTGQMAFEFSLPVVSERIAQCNEATGYGIDYDRFREWPCEGATP